MSYRQEDYEYIWMTVTDDKYELPIIVEDSAKLLAKKLGVAVSTVISQASNRETGKYKNNRKSKVGRRIVRVKIKIGK